MASAERQAENKKIEEENLFKSLSAEEKQAETDAFQCSRCKQVSDVLVKIVHEFKRSIKRKCRYRQAQTRSADEPMTVCAHSSPGELEHTNMASFRRRLLLVRIAETSASFFFNTHRLVLLTWKFYYRWKFS